MFFEFIFLNDELFCLRNCSIDQYTKKVAEMFLGFFVSGCKMVMLLISDLPVCMFSFQDKNKQTNKQTDKIYSYNKRLNGIKHLVMLFKKKKHVGFLTWYITFE